jgi:hypothetical protein
VYDEATCVGWCQFGSPDELPRIKHRRAYLQGLAEPARAREGALQHGFERDRPIGTHHWVVRRIV